MKFAFSAAAPVFPQISGEDALLLSAISQSPTRVQNEQIKKLWTSTVDWQTLITLATRHDVVPFLYLRCQQMPSGAVPADVMTALAAQAHACVAWNLHLQTVLLHLLRSFNREHIAVMPLKGLLLSELLYGDSTARPTNDLDLLVHECDIELAIQVLTATGCRRPMSADQEDGLYHYLFSFGPGDDSDVLIELHRDLTSAHLARLDVQQVWAAAQSREWCGCIVWGMRTEDLFLYLCTHAMRDGLGSIKNLLDIVLVTEKYRDTWSWDDVRRTIVTAHVQTPVWLTLWHCQQLFPLTLPPGFLDSIRPSRSLGSMLGNAFFAWRGGVLHSPVELLRSPMGTILSFLWEDSWRGKLRHGRRMIFPSAELRSRRTGLPSATSLVRSYVSWVRRAWSQLTEQLREHRRTRDHRSVRTP